MKKIIIVFLLAILVGAYSIFWYIQAEEGRVIIADAIKSLDHPKEGIRVQEAGLKTGGYPFNYKVKIKNPRLATPQVEMFLDGFLTVGTNLFGTTFWIEHQDEVHFLMPSDRVILNGDLSYTWKISNPHPLHSMTHPFEELVDGNTSKPHQIGLEDITSFVLNGNKIEIKQEKQIDVKATTVDHIDYTYTKENPSKDIQKYNFNAHLKGFELGSIPHPFKHVQLDTFYPGKLLSTLGKMDLEFAGAISVSKDYKTRDTEPFFYIEIDKLVSTNEFGVKEVTGNFKYDPTPQADTHVHLELNSMTEIDEKNYKHITEFFINFLGNIAKMPPNERNAIGMETLQKLLTCCREDLEKIVPHYHELSPIKFNVLADGSFNAAQLTGSAQIQRLDFATNNYGIHIHGMVKAKQVEISGKITLDLTNYKTFFGDIVAYYNRVHFLLPIFAESPENAPPLISDQTTAALFKFLKTISDQPNEDAKNLSITINFLEPQSVMIGTLTLPQAIIEWGKFLKEAEKDIK